MIFSHDLLLIFIRSILALGILFIVTKMLGKKQMSQLTIYDYIISITIGSITADTFISLDKHFINGVFAIFIFGLTAYMFSYLAIKFANINNFLNGKVIILMENGNLILII